MKSVFLVTLWGLFLFFCVGFLNNIAQAQESCPNVLTKELKINQIDLEVKELQKYLNRNGFLLAESGPGSPGKETNFFGELTKTALIKFQTKNNIEPVSGIFDLATRNYLGCKPLTSFSFTQNLTPGMTSLEVKELQKYLNRNGFILAKSGPGSPGNETTFFGNLTKLALLNFQIENKIPTTNGVFDLNTREFLNKNNTEINSNPTYNIPSTNIVRYGIVNRQKYSLIYSAGANGSLTGNLSQEVIKNRDGSSVLAVANAGYHFVNWSDGSTQNPRTDLNVSSNLSVTANFESDSEISSFTLTYTAGSNGSITGTTPQTVNHNGNGTAVTAVPNSGYHFVDWSDSSTQNPRTDTSVTGNVSVTANFAINTYTITSSAGSNGSISPLGVTTKNYNTTQTYTITPNSNYHITDVLVDGSSVGAVGTYSFTNISTNHTISVTFTINTHTLTINNSGNGSGSTTGAGTYNYGTSVTLTNTPDISSNFTSWGGNADCTDGSVTLDADKTCTATFTLKTFTLTYSANPNGTLSGSTSQNVNYNTSGTAVTAVADSGYHFVDWSDDSTQNPRTDTNVTSNMSVTANFAFDVPVYSDWRWQPLSSTGNTVFTSALANKTDSLSVDLAIGQTEEIILELDNVDNGGIFTYQLEGDSSTVWEVNASQSFDSTNGIDGNWTVLETNLPGDAVGPTYELRDVNLLAGPHRWFKFNVKNLGTAIQTVSNFGLRKFSATDNDYWIFAGASIEAMSIDYRLMNEQAKADYGYDPLIFNRGASAKTVQWLDDNIQSILDAHPKAKFVTIHMGGNNVSNIRPYSTVSQPVLDDFSDSYRSIINKIKAAGKVPVPARISFRAYPNDPLDKPGTYGGGMPQNGSLPFNTEIIDPLIAELTPDFYDNRVGRGVVDLYTAILNRQEALNPDGVHPNEIGRQIYRDVWNDTAFKIIYSGVAPDYIVPMTFNTPAEDVDELVVIAETSREPVDINIAQDAIDSLDDWSDFVAEQAAFQVRLNQIVPITSLRYWVDFGSSSYQASPNWNNLTAITTGSTISNLVSDGGVSSDIDLTISYEFPAINSSGGLDFTGLPTYAMRDSFFLRSYLSTDSELTLSSLNPSKNYSLSFYSSANNASSYVTDFTINGTKKSVTSSGNSSEIIAFNNIVPDINGEIIITIGTDTNYGYLNAMGIREIDNLPSCSDGIQNQDETGIDTGGICGVPHTLTYTAGSNGSITGTTPQTVNHSGNGTAVTAVPDSGYHFVDWSDSSTQNPRTDTSVMGDISVTANFAINTYTLTYTAGSNGSITGTTPQTVNHNGNGTAVTAVADAGYHFVDWSDSSTQNPRTDTSVTDDISVTANFAIDTGTCSDGIQNQDETGIDTGGVCAAKTYLIDFGSSLNLPPSNWNTITAKDGSVSNIKDDTEVQSAIDVSITTPFASIGNTGVDTTTGIYPRDVIVDNMYIGNGATPPVITFSSLNIAKSYDFTFFSSRSGTGTRNSSFIINGVTVSLNALGNTNNTVSINNVTPDVNGIILVTVQPEGAASFAYLNAIELTEH